VKAGPVRQLSAAAGDPWSNLLRLDAGFCEPARRSTATRKQSDGCRCSKAESWSSDRWVGHFHWISTARGPSIGDRHLDLVGAQAVHHATRYRAASKRSRISAWPLSFSTALERTGPGQERFVAPPLRSREQLPHAALGFSSASSAPPISRLCSTGSRPDRAPTPPPPVKPLQASPSTAPPR
jgi:hypothetical protein